MQRKNSSSGGTPYQKRGPCNRPDAPRDLDLAPGAGAAFCAELDRIVRSNFARDYWDISLPSRLDTSSSRSPVPYA